MSRLLSQPLGDNIRADSEAFARDELTSVHQPHVGWTARDMSVSVAWTPSRWVRRSLTKQLYAANPLNYPLHEAATPLKNAAMLPVTNEW